MRELLLIIIISISFFQNTQSQDRDNLKKQIDKIILYDTEINFEKTPALIIGVKVKDSLFYFGYGSLSKEKEVLPNENTLFEIGGLTKSFTGSLVTLLEQEGKLNLDSSLNYYLPKDKFNSGAPQLTLEKLLTHTSGMPRMPTEFGVKELEDNNPYAHYSKKDLMDFYQEYVIIPPRKSKKKKRKKKGDAGLYSYSHVNYALLEAAIENATNQDFEKVLLEKILLPVGLADTRVQLSAEQKSRFATGYSISGNLTPAWTFNSFKASEGLKSSAKDLLKFAEVHIGKNYPEFSSAFEKTHPPLFKTGLSKTVYTSRGWHVIKNKKYYDVIAHSGNTNGHRAFLGLVKETDTAVVVLANSKHDLNGLGYLILQMINNYWQKW